MAHLSGKLKIKFTSEISLIRVVGFRKLCRIKKCNNIQGVPFENLKLVSLPVKPEMKQNHLYVKK